MFNVDNKGELGMKLGHAGNLVFIFILLDVKDKQLLIYTLLRIKKACVNIQFLQFCLLLNKNFFPGLIE